VAQGCATTDRQKYLCLPFFPENLKNRIAKEKRRVILVFTPEKPGVSSLEIEQRNEMCGSVPVTRDGLENK